MSGRRPFITDPDHLAVVEGQRYVVFRPVGQVQRTFETLQRQLRETLADPRISFPLTGHVTLRGFPIGTSVESITRMVEAWALTVPPLMIEAEALATFPPPWQVVIVQVRTTPELERAYGSLAEAARRGGLPVLPELERTEKEWVFHMSLCYCTGLDDAAWRQTVERADPLRVSPVTCVVDEVEVIAFDEGSERLGGAFSLTGEGQGSSHSPDG
jgi:2'-5' RNA ligase